jgi:hypothetical protein
MNLYSLSNPSERSKAFDQEATFPLGFLFSFAIGAETLDIILIKILLKFVGNVEIIYSTS